MKKQGLLFALLAGFTLLVLGSCVVSINDDDERKRDGKVVSEERSAPVEFDTVVLKGIGDVRIYPGRQYKGEDYAAVVTTDSNLQDEVSININDNCLYINGKNRSNCSPAQLVIEVYLPVLKCVKLEGVGDIKVYEGSVSSLKIVLSGVGDIDTAECQAENVEVNLYGAGDVRTSVNNTLTVKHTGIGDIYYRGNPPVRYIESTGIGDVKALSS